MTPREAALQLAVLKIIIDGLTDTKKTTNGEVAKEWEVKDRISAVLPDGTKIGTITLCAGRTSAKIDDEDAYLEWVLTTHPEEIEQVVRVNPGFTARMLSFAKKSGTAVDPATGEEVPGITITTGDPYVLPTLTEDAVDEVGRAWGDGSLNELLAPLVGRAIEAGEVASDV